MTIDKTITEPTEHDATAEAPKPIPGDQIKEGRIYSTTIGGRVTLARVTGIDNARGGFKVRNLATGRPASAVELYAISPAEADSYKHILMDPKNRLDAVLAATPDAKPASLLDVAEQILREEGRPLTAGDIIKIALARALWATCGKTPQNTLSAALNRDINAKGSESRFDKPQPGLYILREGR